MQAPAAVVDAEVETSASSVMRNQHPPGWWPDAHWYYSRIEHRPAGTVNVLSPADGEVSATNPGTLILRLEARTRVTRIVHANGREGGVIQSNGWMPGFRFVLCREESVPWVLSVRSMLRKRHRLEVTGGDVWTFDTPFFWWQHLTGTVRGRSSLIGRVGPSKALWGWAVEPERDTVDILAAVAFMHWKWWHW